MSLCSLCGGQVVQQGQELAAGIAEAADAIAGGAAEGEGAAPLDSQARVQLLLEFLHDRQLDLEELAEERRARFEQCVQLGEPSAHPIPNNTSIFIIPRRMWQSIVQLS